MPPCHRSVDLRGGMPESSKTRVRHPAGVTQRTSGRFWSGLKAIGQVVVGSRGQVFAITKSGGDLRFHSDWSGWSYFPEQERGARNEPLPTGALRRCPEPTKFRGLATRRD